MTMLRTSRPQSLANSTDALALMNWRRQFISASASVELAKDWGREVRNIVMSDAYQAVYSTRLQEDSKAAGKWNTQEGGCYYAVGVGGSPLGRGADIFLIDDPLRRFFAGEVETAARFVLGVLDNEKEPTETRLRAAVIVMDRGVGKPIHTLARYFSAMYQQQPVPD